MTPQERAEKLYDPISDCFTAYDDDQDGPTVAMQPNRLLDILRVAIEAAEGEILDALTVRLREAVAHARSGGFSEYASGLSRSIDFIALFRGEGDQA